MNQKEVTLERARAAAALVDAADPVAVLDAIKAKFDEQDWQAVEADQSLAETIEDMALDRANEISAMASGPELVDEGAANLAVNIGGSVVAPQTMKALQAIPEDAGVTDYAKVVPAVGIDAALMASPTKLAQLAGKLPQAVGSGGQLLRALGLGAAEGVAYATGETAGNVLTGREAGEGVGLSLLAPVAGAGLAQGVAAIPRALKKGSENIITSTLSPTPTMMTKGPKSTRFTAEETFEQGLVSPTGGIERMAENVNAKLDEIEEAKDAVLAGAKDKKFDFLEIMRRASDRVKDLRLEDDIVQQMQKAEDNWLSTMGRMAPDGNMNADDLLAMRTRLGKRAKFQQIGGTAQSNGDVEYARILREELNDAIAEQLPEFRRLDNQQSKLISQKDAIERGMMRGQKNQMLSFGDAAVMGFGGAAGGIPGAAAAKAVRMATLSPSVAYFANKAASKMEGLGVLPLSTLAGRAAMAYPEE